MISNLSYPKRKRPIKMIVIAVAVVAAVVLGAFWLFGLINKKAVVEYPLYQSFGGNYVFSVPKEYSVDEQSALGIQLVYSGTFTVSTVADVYDVGGVSARSLSEYSGGDFKQFVNDTFVPNLKKDIGTEDVEVKFSRDRGQDAARITAKKDGKSFRFVYLRSGKHPVALVGKEENDTLKKIAETVVDVEDSALKDDAEPIKQAIQDVMEDAKAGRIDELYDASAPELQTSSTKEQVGQAIENASEFVKGNVVISGGSINEEQNFSAAIRFTKIDDNEGKNPAFGSLVMKKIDGQWKLVAFGVPSPTQE